MYFNKTKTRTIKLKIVLFLILLLFQFSLTQNTRAVANNIDPYSIYNKALQTIDQKFYFKPKLNLDKWENLKYKTEIRTLDDAHRYIENFINSLGDPYTRLLTKEEFKEEEQIISSQFVGIGVKLASNSHIVLDVLPNSPANKEGIKPQDYILAVNDISTRKLNTREVANLLRGPKETTLKITIKRGHEIITKVVKRDELKINPVSTQLLENGIALIKVESFIPEDTSKVFKEELSKLSSAKGVIIDLRNNSGGLLKNAVEIADMFLSSGKIVSTVGYFGKLNEFANSSKLTNASIVILVNEHTASASEILASALRENDNAIIVGKRTFGKGLVQEVVKLPDESALHVTIGAYYTPKGKNINKVGITPDKVVYDSEKQLVKAKEILTNLINKRNNLEIALLN